jgi:hypothetical protein
MPNDVWIEEMSAKYPSKDWSENIDQIAFECLVNFADVNVNDGKVYDCEVGPVMYSTRDGWMRNDYVKFKPIDILNITHWMYLPDPVADKDAQVVYNENVAKHC